MRRRRRIAILCFALVAGASFAFGAAMGDDGAPSAPKPSAASKLGIPELAGQRVVAGFSGTTPPGPVRRMIREGKLAGVILFSANLPSRDAGRRLVRKLQAIPRGPGLRDPLLVMIDQEGGLVKRIGGAPTVSAEAMGARGAAFSRRQGRLTARNLRDLGVNVDLAPVLDVARAGGVIEETDRGFGDDPAQVTRTAIPFAEALAAGGVSPTAKHFPGLGSAAENTDFAVQRLGISKARLRSFDEPPYEPFAAIPGSLVMMNSAIYPAFGPKPAAFSRELATGELRGRIGFHGVSLTDALGAAAVQAFGGPAKAGVSAASAGTDVLLFGDWQSGLEAHRALVRGLRSKRLDRTRFERSVQRVLALRHRFR